MSLKPESLLAHADFVRALARSLVLDEHRADDVVQETWLAALERPPRLGGNLRSWLGTVARNFAFMARRSETRRTLREGAAARRERIDSTEKIVEWESVRRRVVDAVLNLEEPYRTAVVLRFYDDLPPREIAKRLEIPVETAKTRLKRGLAQLRVNLDKQHGGDGRSWCLAIAPIAGLKIGAASAGIAAGSSTVSSTSAGAASLSASISGALAMTVKVKVGITIGFLVCITAAIFMLVQDDNSEDFTLESVAPPAAESSSPPLKEVAATTTPAAKPLRESIPASGSEIVEILCRVVDIDGNPVEGAAVEKGLVEEYYTARDMPEGLRWEKTGISSLPNGRLSVDVARNELLLTFLRVRHPDFYHESGRFYNDCIAVSFAVPSGEDSYSLDDIRMAPARFIRGIVKDGDGKPVSGCTVSAPGKPWAPEPWANHDINQTDAGGRFRLKLHEATLTCRATAYHEAFGMGFSEEVTPGLGDSIPEVEIRLKRCRTLAGKLTYFNGTPTAGRILSAACTINGSGISRQSVTDDEGHFEFAPLIDGAYEIKVRPDARGVSKFMVLAKGVRPGDRGLVLQLPRTSLVRIHLEDIEGRLVDTRPEIYLSLSSDSPPSHFVHLYLNKYKSVAPGKAVRTSPGIFELHFLRDSTLDLDVMVEGFSTCHFQKVEIPPPPGEIELKAVLEPVRSIRGKVIHADGSPARDVRVLLEWDEGRDTAGAEPWRTQIFRKTGARMRRANTNCPRRITDEEGFFHFTGLESGSHVLYFNVKGLEVCHEGPVSVSRAEPHAELSVSLPALTGVIEGMVGDEEGNPLSGACVMAWDGRFLFNRTRSGENGQYIFPGLPDGRYVVDVQFISGITKDWIGGQSGDSWRNASEKLEDFAPFNAIIEAGAACRLDLTIEDCWNSVIKGRIVADPSAISSNLRIFVHELDTNDRVLLSPPSRKKKSPAVLFRYPNLLSRRDQDKRIDHFRFENLRTGRYKVTVSMSGSFSPFGGEIVSEPFFLEASAVHTVDIHLPGTNVNGIVTDKATKEPVSEARVILRKPSKIKGQFKTMEMKSSEDGTFEREAIPPGTYTLIIHHPDHGPLIVEDFQLLQNEDRSDLCFELESGSGIVKGVLQPATGEWKNEGIWYVRPVVPPLGIYEYADGWADDKGAFTLNGLPAGPVKLIVYHSFKQILEKTVTLPLPEGKSLVIDLP